MVLESLNLEDYNDFEFDNTPSMKGSDNDKTSEVALDEDLHPNAIPVLKSENYDAVTYVPKAKTARVAKFREECNFVESLIENGKEHAARIAIARMKQLVNELEGIVNPDTGEGVAGTRPPASKQEARRLKADQGNQSAMNYTKGTSGSKPRAKASSAGRKRARSSSEKTASNEKTKKTTAKASAKTAGPCQYCSILSQHKDFKIRFDHNAAACSRVEEYTDFMNAIDEADDVKAELAI